jgi:dolichol kinase
MSLVETIGDRMSEDESIARRGVHSLSSVVGLAYVIGLLQWNEVRIMTGVGFAVIVLLEVDRLVLGNSLLDPLYRDYEQESPAGYAYAISGMFLAVLLFEPSVAVAAVFILSFADPIVGLVSPNKLLRVKPVPVLVAMLVTSFVVIVATDVLLPDVLQSVSPVEAPLGNPFPPIDLTYAQAAAGAVGATLADGIKFRVAGEKPIEIVDPGMELKGYVVDDNLTIPFYSGVLMTLVALV